jgi:Tfp pilus assembly protein PilP
MKRTLAISLWLALGTSAVAQNPAVVQKNVQTSVKATASTQTSMSAKPSPTTVRVVPVTASKSPVVVAKPVAVAVKPLTVQAKTTVQAKPAVVAVQAAPSKTVTAPAAKTNVTPAAKPVAVAVPVAKVQISAPAAHQAVVAPTPHVTGTTKAARLTKADPFKSAKTNTHPASAAKSESTKAVASKNNTEQKKPLAAAVAKSVGQAGRRDPFISPVVTMSAVGSGCSSGKRCLAIDQIALRGIVKSDNGMIAVVVNAAAKAYFLRENDPVFNGYVVKITGDSIVFKESFRDRLGKSLTRDITKTISRPVA